MDKQAYEQKCLIRSPGFRRDFERLRQEQPRLFNRDLWPRDAYGRPDGSALIAEGEALRAFRVKYPACTADHVFHIVQPSPLVFDPAWKACADQAVFDFLSRCGQPPRGVITRVGVESAGEEATESEEIHVAARRHFEATSEQDRADYRANYGPTIFGAARVFLPIGLETTLEQVKRLWPLVERAKTACYGVPIRKKAPRLNLYEARLMAYDLVREQRLTVKAVAHRTGKNPRTVLRRLQEAVADIEGVKKWKLGPEDYSNHVVTCKKCQQAEKKGISDLYCSWMQRRLGARSGWIKSSESLREER